ncbi:hypothetical protein [Actinomadura roseirufa]|uniref:hypothetical protein n=1 Tax=Actinomadura roseirufa TaxID=2094049 RepID=UPI0010410701|nr:hypothetical protein [Actinomadura roseirufa]
MRPKARTPRARAPPDLDVTVRERVLDEAAGNPLALLELLAGLTVGERTGLAALRALGLLHLGLGRHEEALRVLQEAAAGPARHTAVVLCALPDLVEAAVRAGDPGRAAAARDRFAAWAAAVDQPWSSAAALRCEALLAPSDTSSEAAFEAAARLHERGGRPFERARTELAHGERLRRARRRSDARVPLRSALAAFERLGAAPWADRARTELRATGETTAARPGGADHHEQQKVV